MLYCAKKAGVTHVLRAGGAQAVAAMAWGTETCPKVGEIANFYLPQTFEGACIYHTTHAELKEAVAGMVKEAVRGTEMCPKGSVLCLPLADCCMLAGVSGAC